MRRYSHSRSSRMADQIQKDIVAILRLKVKDPRISWVTVSDVVLSDDNSWARIYWTVLDEKKRTEVTKALEDARGFIRSALSKGLHTYTVPQLKFIYDESLVRGSKILNIISEISQEFSKEEDDKTPG